MGRASRTSPLTLSERSCVHRVRANITSSNVAVASTTMIGTVVSAIAQRTPGVLPDGTTVAYCKFRSLMKPLRLVGRPPPAPLIRCGVSGSRPERVDYSGGIKASGPSLRRTPANDGVTVAGLISEAPHSSKCHGPRPIVVDRLAPQGAPADLLRMIPPVKLAISRPSAAGGAGVITSTSVSRENIWPAATAPAAEAREIVLIVFYDVRPCRPSPETRRW